MFLPERLLSLVNQIKIGNQKTKLCVTKLKLINKRPALYPDQAMLTKFRIPGTFIPREKCVTWVAEK